MSTKLQFPVAHCFIHNTATSRIHLCLFRLAPGPGRECVRWRSFGHHTEGAEDQAGADRHLEEFLDGGISMEFLGHVEWDGEGVPAMNVIGRA